MSSRNVGDIFEDDGVQYIITDVKEETWKDGSIVMVETAEKVI